MTKGKDKKFNHLTTILRFPTLKYSFLSFSLFFLIIFSVFSYGGNYFLFNENFNSISRSSECSVYPTYTSLITLNNNNWYCSKNTSVSQGKLFITNNSITLDYKTLSGNKFFMNGTGRYYMKYVFNDIFSFSDLSYLEFYCKEFIDITAGLDHALCFNDENGVRKFCLTLDNKNIGGDSSCTTFITGATSNNCLDWNDLSYISNACVKATSGKKINRTYINGSEIFKTGRINKSLGYDLKEMEFISSYSNVGPRGSYFKIDDLSLYIINGSNELPKINASFNVECLNNSENANIEFNISENDKENDNVYYSFNKFQQTYLDYTISFSQLAKFSDSVSLPNYVFGSMLNNNSNECVFTDSVIFPNPNEINLVYHWSIGNSDKHMINLKNCLGKESLDFNLKQSYSDFKLIIPVYDFKTSNEAFNVSFYNFDKSILINKFGFKVTNNLLNFSEWNGSQWVSMGISNITQYSKFTYFMGGSTGQPILYINSLNNPYVGPSNDKPQQKKYENLTILDRVTNVNRVVIDYENNSNFFIESFDFTGVAESLNFSTNKPTFMNVSRTGNVKINIYVSDNQHLTDNEYTLYTYNVNVQDCRNYIEGVLNTDDISKASKGFDPIAFFNALLGKPFRGYMSRVDTNNIAQLVIWWVYIILFIGSFVSHYLLTKIPDIIIPLAFSSLIILFISILGGYVPSILVSGVGLAIVFMAMFTNAFKGGASG